MTENEVSTEYLFAYGTLQLEGVQMATFGRLVSGTPDMLSGFELVPLDIEDEKVIALSGKSQHALATYTGRDSDTIAGMTYSLSPEEIQRADAYEVQPCIRVAVVLRSGTHAWVYVDGRYPPPGS